MSRRLFNVATAVSVLLCATFALLWTRSARHTDVCMVAGPADGCFLLTSNVGGWVEFTAIPDGWGARGVRGWSMAASPRTGGYLARPGPFVMWQWPSDVWSWRPKRFSGEFELRRGTPAVLLDASTGKPLLDRPVNLPPAVWASVLPGSPHWRFPPTWELRAPHWALVLLTAALPAARGARRAIGAAYRRSARPAGLCRHCGYDLRATPDRCPECGAATGATVMAS